MTKEEIEAVAKCAAKQAVDQTLERLGFDVERPLEVQQDVAFLHRQRVASESIGRGVRRSLIGLAIAGVASVFLIGLKQYLGK